MGKIVFVALIGALVWLFFFVKPRRPKTGARNPASTSTPTPAPTAPNSAANSSGTSAARTTVESMVQCARCGVFMPPADSVLRDGKISCAQPQLCHHAQASRP